MESTGDEKPVNNISSKLGLFLMIVGAASFIVATIFMLFSSQKNSCSDIELSSAKNIDPDESAIISNIVAETAEVTQEEMVVDQPSSIVQPTPTTNSSNTASVNKPSNTANTTPKSSNLEVPQIVTVDNVPVSQPESQTQPEQPQQQIPVTSIKLNLPTKRLYGDDEFDVTLTVFPNNATYDEDDIYWDIHLHDNDEQCAKLTNGKVHVIAKYCNTSPAIIVSLGGASDYKSIPIERTFLVTDKSNNQIKQGAIYTHKLGEEVYYKANKESGVIWTVTDYDSTGGAIEEFSRYSLFTRSKITGRTRRMSKIELKSMYTDQTFYFYVKVADY